MITRQGPCIRHIAVSHRNAVRRRALLARDVASQRPATLRAWLSGCCRSRAVASSATSQLQHPANVASSSTSHWQEHLKGKSIGERTALQSYMGLLDSINRLEDELVGLSDEELKEKTATFRERLKQGGTREDVLVEAFAVVREASKRVLGMRHYDVQVRCLALIFDNGVRQR